MFKILGAILAIYTVHAAITGKVYAKSGASCRTVSRQDSPTYFWAVITIYGALSAALMTVF
jgi:hypothetical protein